MKRQKPKSSCVVIYKEAKPSHWLLITHKEGKPYYWLYINIQSGRSLSLVMQKHTKMQTTLIGCVRTHMRLNPLIDCTVTYKGAEHSHCLSDETKTKPSY